MKTTEVVLPEYGTEGTSMPRFKCHKEVHAFKIREIKSFDIGSDDSGRAQIVSTDGGVITVGPEYMKKHRPQIGGYFVVYEDGYQSFSPAAAFESGYSLIKEKA